MDQSETKKFYLGQALKAFETHLSKDTGLIHYDEHRPFSSSREKASIYHSFLYVYALFSKKQKESILEASKLLERLLSFQSKETECYGSFPRYMHEYPTSYDKLVNLDIFHVFMLLIENFSLVIERKLFEKFSVARNLLEGFLKNIVDPSSITSERFNVLLGNEPCLLELDDDNSISLEYLSEIVLKVSLLPLNDQKAQLLLLETFFHKNIGVYNKLYSQQKSYFGMQGLSFFELAMSIYLGKMGEGVKISDHLWMKSVLLLQNLFQNQIASEDCDDTLIVAKNNSENDRYYQALFKVLIKENDHIFSLVSENHALDIESKAGRNCLECDLTYPKEVPEDGLDQVEFSMFFSDLDDVDFFVDEIKATVFYLDDSLSISTLTKKIILSFLIIEGQGNLIGQISKGNRPSDKTPIEGEFSKAHDWIVSLRTLRRDAHLKLKLKLSIYDLESTNLVKKVLENQQRPPLHEVHYQHTK